MSLQCKQQVCFFFHVFFFIGHGLAKEFMPWAPNGYVMEWLSFSLSRSVYTEVMFFREEGGRWGPEGDQNGGGVAGSKFSLSLSLIVIIKKTTL